MSTSSHLHNNINISKPTESDAGHYICRISFRTGGETASLNITAGYLNVFRKLYSDIVFLVPACLSDYNDILNL